MKMRNINLIVFWFIICFSIFSCKENQKDITEEDQKEAVLNSFTDEFTKNLFIEGVGLLEKGEVEEARTRFYEANEIEPGNIYVLNTIASVEYQHGDFYRAMELYQTNIDSHPEFFDTYIQYSTILIENREVPKAIEILNIGESHLPETENKKYEFFYNLALAHYLNRDCEMSQKYVETVLEMPLDDKQTGKAKKLREEIKNNCR